jgi:small subunit ribosomal protein S17
MAEEEKDQATEAKDQDDAAEDAAEAATPPEAGEEPEPAEEKPADEETSEEEPAEEPAAEEPAVEESAEEAPAAEAEADLDPKSRRRLERSRASGPPDPPRSAEERATERAENRRGAGERRRRYRAARRRKRGEPGSGTAPAPREPGPKKVRQGTVVSAGGDKTITVEIAVVRRHPTYEKVVRRTSRLHAHDEANQAQQGDVVRVVESRPLSRTKRWRLLEILEKAR